MPIESRCAGCGKMLRVADEHAGKRARCPECGFVYTVAANSTPSAQQEQPLAGPQQSGPSASAPLPATQRSQSYSPAPQPIAEPTTTPAAEMWYMRTPEGQIYGPVQRRQLDVWVSEGRVTHDCQLRQGEYGDWQAASVVFPVLAPVQPQFSSGRPTSMAGGAYRPQPPSSAGYYPPRGTHMRPHRGPVILVLAILSWPLGCILLSIIAWVMAAEDIGQMRRGLMDPSGMGMTQAGQIIAIINVALTVLSIVGFCLLAIAADM